MGLVRWGAILFEIPSCPEVPKRSKVSEVVADALDSGVVQVVAEVAVLNLETLLGAAIELPIQDLISLASSFEVK